MTDDRHSSRAPKMAALGFGLGFLSHAMFNKLRRRPVGYQPWWHVIMGVSGMLAGKYLGNVYDEVTDEMNLKYAGAVPLPVWMQGAMSEEEKAAMAKQEVTEDMKKKWLELSRLEEQIYLQQRASRKLA